MHTERKSNYGIDNSHFKLEKYVNEFKIIIQCINMITYHDEDFWGQRPKGFTNDFIEINNILGV